MSPRQLSVFLKTFQHARYHPQVRLLTWHPRGILDDTMADAVVAMLELEETFGSVPFHRYADFSLLTGIHLRIRHIFELAERRHAAAEPVRSAFLGDSAVSFAVAHMYESLMEGAIIHVRAFRNRYSAAGWLGVPESLLKAE
jgi:hypothetical protein